MKKFNPDDELADIIKPETPPPAAQPQPQPAPTAPPAPVQTQQAQQAQAAPKPATAPASILDDIEDAPPTSHQAKSGSISGELTGEEVDWGNEELMKKGDGVDRIRPEKGKDNVKRLALIKELPPRGLRRHFIQTKDGKRNLICLATKDNPIGFCCKQADEEGQYHAIAGAVEYLNINPKTGKFPEVDGKPVVPEVKVGFVDLSRSNYRAISNLPEEGESLYDYDLVMSMDGNKYSFTIKSRKARWMMYPEVVAQVEAAVKRILADGGSKFYKKLGKKLSLIEWKAVFAGQAGGAAEASLDEMDDIK
jgi:hypothetical protein